MAFSDFVYPDLLSTFGLNEQTAPEMFTGVSAIPPDPALASRLPINIQLATSAHSELARSIWLVGPVLSDLWSRYRGRVCLNAGVEFNADPDSRLSGYCDFVVSRGPQRSMIGPPVLLVFEAKRDSIPDGLGQCIAGLVGAQRYNQRHNTPIDPIYGCVTTGSLWKFMRLSGSTLTQDLTEYNLAQIDRILGILIHIIGPVPQPAAA